VVAFEFDLQVQGRDVRVELTAAAWPDS
jgi:hypothetical protein